MDVDKLLKALDDDSNEDLLNLTTKKIDDLKLTVLRELHLSAADTNELMEKLKGYRYADEMNELKNGTYLRWVPLNDPTNLKLTKGAIFCELKITNDGIYLVCKNFGFNGKRFQINMGECLIFRKLTAQEMVLLSALDHLSK